MLKLHKIKLLLLLILIPAMISCKGKPGGSASSEADNSVADSLEQKTENAEPSSSSVLKYNAPSDPVKEQALQEASLNGDLATVSNIIAAGVNVNAIDQEGRTALMYASFNGHTEIVRKLIDHGAIVSIRDEGARTALLYASTGPFPETVKLLLENNADPNIVDADEHFTPIMHAAAEGQLEVVKILLEYGADPSLKDVDGETASMFAAQNGHTEVVTMLEPK